MGSFIIEITNAFMSILSARNNGSIGELESVFSGASVKIPAESAQGHEIDVKTPEVIPEGPQWIKKPEKTKSTIVPCIIIDRQDKWHHRVKVDLHGADATDYTWLYYGFNYPVLVEQENGTLEPFFLPEDRGENPNVLYKKATSPGYRATFMRKSSMMQKLQTGLMAGVVIGLFVLMFVLLDWE